MGALEAAGALATGQFLPLSPLLSLAQGPPNRKKPGAAPEVPEKEASAAQRRARDRIRERAMLAGATTRLTGPSGLTTEATTAPKTLLGA